MLGIFAHIAPDYLIWSADMRSQTLIIKSSHHNLFSEIVTSTHALLRRSRRDVTGGKKYIEVLLVADQSVFDFIGKERVTLYLLTLMNIVSTCSADGN